MEERYLNVPEAAAYIRASVSLMNKWRMADRRDEGPPWIVLGKKRVVYDRLALDEWMKTRGGSPSLSPSAPA